MKLKRLNVVLVPPASVANQAIHISRHLASTYPVSFTLDNLHYFPHISIYSTAYPLNQIDQVFSLTRQLAATQAPIKLHFKDIQNSSNSPCIEFIYTGNLKSQHQQFLQALNPLRLGHLRPKYQPSSPVFRLLSPKQQSIVKCYGYIEAGPLHHPHLTLTHLRHPLSSPALRSLRSLWTINSFISSSIGIFAMGKHGTCTRPLQFYQLT